MSETAISKPTVQSLLETYKDKLKVVLPRGLTPERITQVALTAIKGNDKLMQCEPASLARCVISASQLGLELDPTLGHAYLVPFKNKCTLIPGYKGLLHLIYNSGAVGTVEAAVVREDEEFEVVRGLMPVLRHVPAEAGNALKNVTHAYAIVNMRNGQSVFDVMTKAEIDKIRSRSKSANYGPWQTDFDEMAKKTVLRRLVKLLPVSVECQRLAAMDEADDFNRKDALPTTGIEELDTLIEEGTDDDVVDVEYSATSIDDLETEMDVF